MGRVFEKVSDAELMGELRELALQERVTNSMIVARLAEVGRRRLYLALGYSSLYEFGVGEFGFSEAVAYRRAAVAKALHVRPEILEHLESGALSCSSAAVIAKHVDVFPQLIANALGKSKRQCERMVAEVTGARPKKPDGMRPVAGGRVEMTIVISQELASKIHEARDLLSHIEEANGVEFVIDRAVTKLVETEKKRRFGVGHFPGEKKQGLSVRNAGAAADGSEKTVSREALTSAAFASEKAVSHDGLTTAVVDSEPVSAASSQRRERQESRNADTLPTGASGRYIAVAVRRQVYERAQGRCEFVGGTGRRCACTARLEIDHIDPFCLGGNHSPDNLRLLCDPHNRYTAELAISNRLTTQKRHEFRATG